MNGSMRRWNGGLAVAVLIAGGVLAGGCTAIRRDDAFKTERTLAAAGFQMKFADTPEKIQSLEAVQPQRTLVPRQQDGQTRFVYADAEFCKCMYVGTDKAYQRFSRLALVQKIQQAQLQTAEANEAASMNWGMWGGWGPWW